EKCGLPEQAPKEIGRFRGARANRRVDRRMRLSFPFCATPEKIDRRKQNDLEPETHHKQLLMRRWREAEKGRMKIKSADEIENPTGNEVADVHDRVDDGERYGALLRGGINPRRREQHRSSQRFTDSEGKNPADKRQPWDCRYHHHTARDRANGDAEKKSP